MFVYRCQQAVTLINSEKRDCLPAQLPRQLGVGREYPVEMSTHYILTGGSRLLHWTHFNHRLALIDMGVCSVRKASSSLRARFTSIFISHLVWRTTVRKKPNSLSFHACKAALRRHWICPRLECYFHLSVVNINWGVWGALFPWRLTISNVGHGGFWKKMWLPWKQPFDSRWKGLKGGKVRKGGWYASG